ncbi:RNA polymerase sigma factor [Paraconexibacter antarcticus]|uniref:RNA polymerase sigma factor n=1 Tax=Paraconexibacter antarcticus TaxID=2949664 RepID=A0ABY5DPK1_9ACTN|nr:RNA polymerase sigma factor [Paraconexibacter antarcticus]UTI63385.1 RNA polymerase sigma factor [Paraconexibacter antarcticus]
MPLSPDDITQLYRLHARRLATFLVRRTHDPEVAMDLVAETFAIAIRDRRRFNGRNEDAGAWLFGIARNLLRHWYRDGSVERRALTRLGMQRPVLTDTDVERLLALTGSDDARARVAAQMASLPEEQRAAVELRVVEERSYDEVAIALGISAQAARARVSRGLRALAAVLEHDPELST